ncbi:MAG: nucleotidyltransferase family protein [Ignavibacteria bacterium]|nr:nucleotidyltransferase family protein [Ignavibacteria bacterium]
MNTSQLNKEKIYRLLILNSDKVKEFGVNKIGLFGSYVRNEFKQDSNVDFIVEFIPGKKNYKNFIHLAYFLEDLFNIKADLLTLNSLSPFLKPYILKEIEYVSLSH